MHDDNNTAVRLGARRAWLEPKKSGPGVLRRIHADGNVTMRISVQNRLQKAIEFRFGEFFLELYSKQPWTNENDPVAFHPDHTFVPNVASRDLRPMSLRIRLHGIEAMDGVVDARNPFPGFQRITASSPLALKAGAAHAWTLTRA
jgi:hypothetical protein